MSGPLITRDPLPIVGLAVPFFLTLLSWSVRFRNYG